MRNKVKNALTIVVTMFLLLALTGCVKENKISDAKRIAEEDFGMQKIITISSGTTNSCLVTQKTRRYLFYVLGEKDGEVIMIIVPGLQKDKAYKIDWPFAFSFYECVAKLNSSSSGTICTETDYELFEFKDTLEDFNRIHNGSSGDEMDLVFYITYKNYTIIQTNNQCVIFGEGFNNS